MPQSRNEDVGVGAEVAEEMVCMEESTWVGFSENKEKRWWRREEGGEGASTLVKENKLSSI